MILTTACVLLALVSRRLRGLHHHGLIDNQKTTVVEFDLGGLTSGAGTGKVRIEIHNEWAPLGAQRFLDLVKDTYFGDHLTFFRVIPGFICQFGLSSDPTKTQKWDKTIQDDPVKMSNKKGTLTFATSGPNTRTTQVSE
jgi:hypothetical protein